MKGLIAVEIPTKKYIKAYVLSKLGDKPVLTVSSDSIGNKMYDVLQHKNNERKTDFKNSRYTEVLKIYIHIRTFKKRGAYLNHTNIRNFNLFIELEIKDRFHSLMDDLIELLPSFENNLPEVRRRLGIDIEDWSDDSMKKDYYRYRLKKNKSLLYNKTFSPVVP